MNPSRRHVLANLVVTQLGWLAAVLGAAHGRAAWGVGVVAVAMAWHLAVSARPRREALLVVSVAALGCGLEALHLATGWVVYATGPTAWPPLWLIALWALFATSLNVSLRWLRGHWWLAAMLGAGCGPLAFASGARLGAVTLLQPGWSLTLLAVLWALALPAVVAWARRFDGIAAPLPAENLHARLA